MLPWVPLSRRSRQLSIALPTRIERDGIDVHGRHARFSCQVCLTAIFMFFCMFGYLCFCSPLCWWVYEKDRPLLEEDGTSSPEQHFGSHGTATVRSSHATQAAETYSQYGPCRDSYCQNVLAGTRLPLSSPIECW
jgi:hypothetical protein